jgi:hypothetical protein
MNWSQTRKKSTNAVIIELQAKRSRETVNKKPGNQNQKREKKQDRTSSLELQQMP